MIFEIDFNKTNNDQFLIDKLGAYWVDTGNKKYPPFEVLHIEIKDFDDLKQKLDIVDKELNSLGKWYSAIVNFDPPCIFLDDDV